jgi:hypothetical protein
MSLKIWLGNVSHPRRQSGRNLEFTIDVVHKVVPDHAMAYNGVCTVFHPERVEFGTVIVNEKTESEVTKPVLGVTYCRYACSFASLW